MPKRMAGDRMMASGVFAVAMLLSLLLSGSEYECNTAYADRLIDDLVDIPASLPFIAPPNGKPTLIEAKRQAIYSRLAGLDAVGIYALARGLNHEDVRIRRSAALALNALSWGFYSGGRGRGRELDIEPALSAIINSLYDRDQRVKELSAHAVGRIGRSAMSAVPALLTMLESDEAGLKISACIGLRGIGPSARAALPALRYALFDPREDIKRFAELAIESVEGL